MQTFRKRRAGLSATAGLSCYLRQVNEVNGRDTVIDLLLPYITRTRYDTIRYDTTLNEERLPDSQNTRSFFRC